MLGSHPLCRRIEVSPLAGAGIVEGRGISVTLPAGSMWTCHPALDLIDEGLVDAQGRAELIRRFRWARRQRVTAPEAGCIGRPVLGGGPAVGSPGTRGDRVPEAVPVSAAAG